METRPGKGGENAGEPAKADAMGPEMTGAQAPGKPARAPAEIDLPEDAFRAMPEETPAETTSMPEKAPPAAKPSLAMPILLALVAGVAGGLGVQAWLGGGDTTLASAFDQRLARLEQVKPAPAMMPAEFADRLSRAERAMAEAASREQALRAEIARLVAAQQAAPAATTLGPELAREIESLRAAIGLAAREAEERNTRLESEIARLGKAPQPGETGANTPTLARTMALARASAIAWLVADLAETFRRDQALGAPLESLKALGLPGESLAPLAPFASTPPAPLASLARELRALAQGSVEPRGGVENTGGAPADFLTRLRQGAASLVEVRRTGAATGTDEPALLARAEQAIARGDLAGAIALVNALPPARIASFAGWKVKAEARAEAENALRELRQAGLAALARAAATP